MILLIPVTFKIGASCKPYNAFLNPSKVAVAIALSAEPPAPIIPTTANCDAPEKSSKDKRQVCKTEKPAVTPAAPKAAPYSPTVKATLRDVRSTASFLGLIDTPTL